MIIDRSHRGWAIASAAVLALAVVVYVPYALSAAGPSGGSDLGLVYGTAGFGLMVFVTLLSVRKKFPIWRIGRAQTWMRGHLWLGALTLPLILLHAGFKPGHGLTLVLMWLFVIVYASGVYGAWLQHSMPRRMLREVPMETIYEQIAQVRAQLVDEADGLVAEASGKLEVAVPVAPSGAAALATVMRVDADDSAPLREFYVNEMRPFLQTPSAAHPLANPREAEARLEKLRALLPAPLHPAITDLDSICEEERQLMRQERLHGVLHAWLLVHAPLSFALMALAVVHVLVALRY